MSISSKKLAKLANTEYRHSYLKEMVTGWVVHQIKQLRQDRNWSQAELGTRAGDKPQSTIARLESADYGNWSSASLFELADAFDVALDIRFVPWPVFIENTDDTSPGAMSVPSFSTEQFHATATGYASGNTGMMIANSAVAVLTGGVVAQTRVAVGVASSTSATIVSIHNQQDFLIPHYPIGMEPPSTIAKSA